VKGFLQASESPHQQDKGHYSAAVMTHEPLPTSEGYSHSRCYASARADCSPKLSGEHLVSDSVLRLTGAKAVTTTHRPWSRHGEPATVGISSFTAKVLCEHHNSALSTYDTAALDFTAAFTYFGLKLLTTPELVDSPEVFSISGDDLQRWVLKTLLAHGAGAVFRCEGKDVEIITNRKIVDLLFDSGPWPSEWGLYIAPTLSDPITPASVNNFYGGCQPFVHKDGYLIGGLVWLGGMALALALFRPEANDGGPLDGALHQPQAVQFLIGDMVKVVKLAWADDRDHPMLSYNGELTPVARS